MASHTVATRSAENGCDGLVDAASVQRFLAETYDAYAQNLAEHVACAVRLSRTAQPQTQTDTGQRVRKLSSERFGAMLERIEWRQLCDYEDRRSLQHIGTQTPLGTLLGILQNPLVVPCAMRNCVVQTLIKAVLASPRLKRQRVHSQRMAVNDATPQFPRWTPSQQLILNVIDALIRYTPSVKFTLTVLQNIIPYQIRHSQLSTSWSGAMNRLISMIAYLREDRRTLDTQAIHCLVRIVSIVDNLDASLGTSSCINATQTPSATFQIPSSISDRAQSSISASKDKRLKAVKKKRIRSSTTADDCSRYSRLPKRIRFTLSELHDEEVVGRHEQSLKRRFWNTSAPSPSVTLRSVLNDPSSSLRTRRSKSSTAYSAAENTPSGLSEDLASLRNRAYRKISEWFVYDNAVRHRCRGNVDKHRGIDTAMHPNFLVQIAADNIQWPSSVLCMALCTARLPRPKVAFAEIATICLHCFRRCSRVVYLRIFTELMVECSAFDDRHCCWTALRPLLLLAKDKSGDNSSSVYVRYCVSYILWRRLSTLFHQKDDDTHASLQDFINYFAVNFGSSRLWIPADERISESVRLGMLLTLQRLNIVSIMEVGLQEGDGTTDPVDCASTAGDEASTFWPLFEGGMRVAAHRAIASGDAGSVFEHVLSSNDTVSAWLALRRGSGRIEKGACEQTKPDWQSSLPMDVLRCVFLYLDPSQLFSAFQVCKVWNSCSRSNWFWHHVYKHRFEMVADDRRNGADSNRDDWRHVFLEKEAANQAIRFLRNRTTGWKYRTCGYVGCLTVLKSSQQQARHHASHVREQQRAAAREQKRKLRTEKRKTEDSRTENAGRKAQANALSRIAAER